MLLGSQDQVERTRQKVQRMRDALAKAQINKSPFDDLYVRAVCSGYQAEIVQREYEILEFLVRRQGASRTRPAPLDLLLQRNELLEQIGEDLLAPGIDLGERFSPVTEIILVGLARKAARLARSIRILVSQGMAHESGIIVLALMETVLGFAYILGKDTEERALRYAAAVSERRGTLVEDPHLAKVLSPQYLESMKECEQEHRRRLTALLGGASLEAASRQGWPGLASRQVAEQLGMGKSWALVEAAHGSVRQGLDAGDYVGDGPDHIAPSRPAESRAVEPLQASFILLLETQSMVDEAFDFSYGRFLRPILDACSDPGEVPHQPAAEPAPA